MYIYIYIWQRLNKSVPLTITLKKARTAQYLKKIAVRKAPAAARKKNKNVNNMIVHNFRQYSIGKGACGRYKTKQKHKEYERSSFSTIFNRKQPPAAAIKMNKNINNMMCHHFRQYSIEKGACGRYEHKLKKEIIRFVIISDYIQSE